MSDSERNGLIAKLFLPGQRQPNVRACDAEIIHDLIAEGRRQALEEAARAAGQALIPEDCSPAEAHGRLMQAAASRDAVLALIKEPKA